MRTLEISRSARNGIQYIENETLRSRFINWKKYFQANGVPDGERLIFHGTKPENIDSIIENGLLLSKCRRKSYGHGIYFSEFPEVALRYGPSLVVCRVMPGRQYRRKENGIPEGYNSKIVKKRSGKNVGFIIVDKEDPILPVFIINNGASFVKTLSIQFRTEVEL